MSKRVVLLACLLGVALPALAIEHRDLVRVIGAGRSDVRAIEQTGAWVNYVDKDGVVGEADATHQAALGAAGHVIEVLTPDISAVYDRNFREGRDLGQYLTYAQFIDTMRTIALNNTGICKLETLGTSYGGRQLLIMKVSDNPQAHENEPAIHFEGDIHGDEKIGWAVAFEMLKYLVTRYGTDTLVTRLVNTREIWLNPMYNPDGYNAASRYNGHNIDLNRNWGWMWGYEGSSQGASPFSEPENRATLGHILRHPAVMFVSFHAGTEYISYPWSCTVLETIPENRLINFLSQRYNVPTGYEYGQGSIGMYEINGSTKDFDYGQGMMGWSIEVHNTKTPPASEIDPTFAENRPAMLEFYHRAGQGIHGTVTDATTFAPVQCQVWVGPANWPCFSEATAGDFHRFYLPGTYDLTFRAPGYRDTALTGVVVPNSGDSSVTLSVQMAPDPSAPLFGFRVIYCDGNASYTADPKVVRALGPHNGAGYRLTNGRRLCIDLDRPIRNGAGSDLTVFRSPDSGTATVKGSDSIHGPWTTIGTANSSQTSFDLEPVGLDSVRYIELTASGTFYCDAVEGVNLTAVSEERASGVAPARLSVAANPARGRVLLLLDRFPEAGTGIVIRDAAGRRVDELPVVGRSAVWSAQEHPAGVYFAVENSGGSPVRVVVAR